MKKLKRGIARMTRPARTAFSAFGKRRVAVEDTVQAAAWLKRRYQTMKPASEREAEATQRFFNVLAMSPKAAKEASRFTETCRRLPLSQVIEAFGRGGKDAAPALIRSNLIMAVRRMRDDKEFDIALGLADALDALYQTVEAARERMLVHVEAGRYSEAALSCAGLMQKGHTPLVAGVSEWMLVRVARAPGEEASIGLAVALLKAGLVDMQSASNASSIGGIVSALALWSERSDPAAEGESSGVPSPGWARAQLERVEAGLMEARKSAAASASIDLTWIRLLGIRNQYNAAFEAMAEYEREHPMSRGATAFFGQVMDRYLRYRHSAGARMDMIAPLLDEEVFADYDQRIEEEERAIWSSWPFEQNLNAALSAAASRASRTPLPRGFRRDGRTRVLVVSSNWNFISPLIEAAEQSPNPQFVFRTLDFQSLTFANKNARPEALFFFSNAVASQNWAAVRKAAPDAARLVDWADVVFVEWANQPAVFFSNMLPPEKRLIVRLHSYEAFANWHYFVNWARVDKILFVAEHIRQVFMTQNRLARQAGLETQIVANRHDFADPISKRSPVERRTLCMLGWATANKDPIFALQVLKALRAEGVDWRLRLVGGGWRELATGFEADYRWRFDAALADAALAGAVDILPHTDNPHEELSRAAYVLSTSHREGTHEAIIEGLSVGCVPIIRNWPMVARYGGARGQFADFGDYIVSTPQEAAEKIRNTPWTTRLAKKLHERARAAYGMERTRAALEDALRLP